VSQDAQLSFKKSTSAKRNMPPRYDSAGPKDPPSMPMNDNTIDSLTQSVLEKKKHVLQSVMPISRKMVAGLKAHLNPSA
jgi:hypothetical protein